MVQSAHRAEDTRYRRLGRSTAGIQHAGGCYSGRSALVSRAAYDRGMPELPGTPQA
jgi:hypothetical protein